MSRHFPRTLLACLALGLAVPATGGAAPAPAAGTPPGPPLGQGVVLSGFRMVQDQGARRWEILSREAVYDGENSAALSGVDAVLTEGDHRTLTVAGTSGRYRSDTRVLTLDGKVRARTLTGYDFTAGKMEWRGAEALVTATGGVTLSRSLLTVRGKSLTHRTDTNTTMMGGGITATWSAGGRE